MQAAFQSRSQLVIKPNSRKTSICKAQMTVTDPVANEQVRKNVARVAVLGASGYTGAEVARLAALHPGIKITAMTGEKQAGKAFSEIYPHLVSASECPKLVKIADVDFSNVDVVFCCLPHATTQATLNSLPSDLKIVDLSADFRLKNPDTYTQWYGHPHAAIELQKEAVYGLTELNRGAVKTGRLIANPGCYPTCTQLPLLPLLKSKMVIPEDIIIDAKSGVSGAGRSAKESNLYCEIAEGFNAYGVGVHRHMPEIEQGVSEAAGQDVQVSFTPHLLPISRGMQTTTYVKMAPGVTVDDLHAQLKKTYENEFFVKVLDKGQVPHTRYIRGSNFVHLNVFKDRLANRAILICVIDNLVKGASGQAMQNLNLMLGYPEQTALTQLAMFP